MEAMASQITCLTIVYSIIYSDADQRNIKASRHWPLCGEFTGDLWIPRTNGQLRGKCFHLMTSSCIILYAVLCRIVLFIKGTRLHLGRHHLRSEHELVSIPLFSVGYNYSPTPNFSGGLVNPLLLFGYGGLITPHCFVWMYLSQSQCWFI